MKKERQKNNTECITCNVNKHSMQYYIGNGACLINNKKKYTYIHTYIHTRTYTHTYIHTYIHVHIHTVTTEEHSVPVFCKGEKKKTIIQEKGEKAHQRPQTRRLRSNQTHHKNKIQLMFTNSDWPSHGICLIRSPRTSSKSPDHQPSSPPDSEAGQEFKR